MPRRHGGACLALVALALACNDTETSRDRKVPEAKRTGPRSVRAELVPHRSLIDEALRAELRRGGLVIDLGTAEQHKYTRGGWATGWSDPREEGGVTHAVIRRKSATLYVRPLAEPSELLLRARTGGAPQEIKVSIDGRAQGSAQIGRDWSIARIALGEVAPGKTIALELTRGGGKGRVEVDWVYLARLAGARPPQLLPRVAPISLGGRVRRALVAPTARSYSFYLRPPEGARLVFDLASAARVEFVVRAETEGGVHELFRGRATPDRLREQVVDLSPLAGQAVRLELATLGDAAATGWGEPTLYVPRERGAAAARGTSAPAHAPAKNLILVVLDTTRADSFTPFSPDTRVHAPVLADLAARATTFTSAYNNENWTKPSVATILSSLYPTSHTARYARSVLPEEVQLLSQHLDRHGFRTALITANAVVSDKFGFDRGWDLFENHSRSSAGNGRPLYRRAARWLEEHHDRGRFFLMVQSVDPHTTYEVPQSYWGRYFSGSYDGPIGSSFDAQEQIAVDNFDLRISRRDLDWIRALYHGEVTFQDEQLGVLLETIDRLGLWDDTVVVVTNDHGEELQDHGHMGHGYTLYEEMIRAPLTVHYPPLFPPATQIDEIVEHVDLAPTLVETLGLPAMPDTDGVSFLDLLRGRDLRQRPHYAIAASRGDERAIRIGRWKLVVDSDRDEPRLFDLERDPDEQRDLAGEAPLAVRLCGVYLGEALGAPRKATRMSGGAAARTLEAKSTDIDGDLRRQLEALGYL
ncbi:MAG TPA: sulfatase [Kofleriaceae bacterium]|nr:sulfatase [Kofleriaceae bacterium]